MANRIAVFAAFIVILAGATYLNGVRSERWKRIDSKLVDTFEARIGATPETLGPWRGEDQPQDPKQFKASGCRKAISRSYVNEETNEVVDIYLVCGETRHVTKHTPDWCYVGAGFTMQGDPETVRATIAGLEEPVEFLTCVFRKETQAGSQTIRIFWTFSDDSVWVAPDPPRIFLARRPALYKVYLIAPVRFGEQRPQESHALEFAKVFFPTVQPLLFTDAALEEAGEPSGPDADGPEKDTAEEDAAEKDAA